MMFQFSWEHFFPEIEVILLKMKSNSNKVRFFFILSSWNRCLCKFVKWRRRRHHVLSTDVPLVSEGETATSLGSSELQACQNVKRVTPEIWNQQQL